MEKKKISVLIPCYNHGKYIQETVDSILASTYKNIEIVIVNDGSTDEYTNRILSELQTKFKQINVITTENQGTAGACKVAAENSTGDYLIPMGSDDKIHPDYLKDAASILNNHKEIGLVYCKAEYFDAKTGPWELPEFSIEQMKHGNCIFCAALYRKSDYDKTEGYHADMRNWEDYDLWISLLELGLEVYKIPKVYFYYRITGVSKTDAVRKDKERGQRLMKQIKAHHPNFFKTPATVKPDKPQPKRKEIYF